MIMPRKPASDMQVFLCSSFLPKIRKIQNIWKSDVSGLIMDPKVKTILHFCKSRLKLAVKQIHRPIRQGGETFGSNYSKGSQANK